MDQLDGSDAIIYRKITEPPEYKHEGMVKKDVAGGIHPAKGVSKLDIYGGTDYTPDEYYRQEHIDHVMKDVSELMTDDVVYKEMEVVDDEPINAGYIAYYVIMIFLTILSGCMVMESIGVKPSRRRLVEAIVSTGVIDLIDNLIKQLDAGVIILMTLAITIGYHLLYIVAPYVLKFWTFVIGSPLFGSVEMMWMSIKTCLVAWKVLYFSSDVDEWQPNTTIEQCGVNTDACKGLTGVGFSTGPRVYPPVGVLKAQCYGAKDLNEPRKTAKLTWVNEGKSHDILKKGVPYEHKGMCPPSEHLGVGQIGMVAADRFGQVAGPCIHSAIKALNDRALLKRKFDITKQAGEALVQFAKTNVEYLFGNSDSIKPMDYDDFKSLYKGRRRTAYADGGDLYGMSCSYNAFDRSIAHINAFTKKEVVIKEKWATPRIVSAGTKAYNWAVAPTVIPFCHQLQKLWSLNNKQRSQPLLTYASGLTREDVGAWFAKAQEDLEIHVDLVSFVIDYHRWDVHVNNYMKDIELLAMEHVMDLPPDFKKWFKTQYTTHGSCYKHNLHYSELEGCVKSGHPNTSSGNSVQQGIVTLWVICTLLNCTPKDMEPWFRMIVLGDDGLVVIPRSMANKLIDLGMVDKLRSIGLDPELEIVELHDAEFCSSVFVPYSEEDGRLKYVMVPKPGRMFMKNYYSKNIYGIGNTAAGYAYGVAMSLITSSWVLPFMRVFYLRAIKYAKKKNIKMRLGDEMLDRSEYMFKSKTLIRPSNVTYDWIMTRYGLTKAEILSFTNWLKKVKHQVCCVSHPVLSQILDVDLNTGSWKEPKQLHDCESNHP